MLIKRIGDLPLKKQAAVKRNLGKGESVKYNHSTDKFQPFLPSEGGVKAWVKGVITSPTHIKALVPQDGTFDITADVHEQCLESLQTLTSFTVAKDFFLANSADLTVDLQELFDSDSLDLTHVDALIATCQCVLVGQDSPSAHVAEHIRVALKALKLPGALDGDATQYDTTPMMKKTFVGEQVRDLEQKNIPIPYSPKDVADFVEKSSELTAFMEANDMQAKNPAEVKAAKKMLKAFHASFGVVGSSDEITVTRKQIPIFQFLEMLKAGVVVEMTPEIAQQRMVNNPKPKGHVVNIAERVLTQIKDQTLEIRVLEYFGPNGVQLIIVDGNNTRAALVAFFDPANSGKVCVFLDGKLCKLTKGLIAVMANQKMGFTTLEGPQHLVLRQVASTKMAEEHTFFAKSDPSPLWTLLAKSGVFGDSNWKHNPVLTGNDTTLFNVQKHLETGFDDQGVTADMILRDFADVHSNVRMLTDIPPQGLFLIKIVAHVLNWAKGQCLDKNRDLSFGKFIASQLLLNVAIRPGMTTCTYDSNMVQSIITGHVEEMAGLNSESDYESEECTTALKNALGELHERVRGDMENTYNAMLYLDRRLKNFPATLRLVPFMIHLLRGIPVTEKNMVRVLKVIDLTKRYQTVPRTFPASTIERFTILKKHDWSLWKYTGGTISWDDNRDTFNASRTVMHEVITDDKLFDDYMAIERKRKPVEPTEGDAPGKRPAMGDA
tara:strand:+ start:3661 stop:5820 length:2160 start_codon:yes stop_codon:yes gene_type:complete